MTNPFGNDLDGLARQYWSAWGDAMRGPAASQPQVPGWQQAVDWWSGLARGGNADANAAVDRFSTQARDWYGQMQGVAAQFAGRDATPMDVAEAWRRALAGMGANPFAELFQSMQGQGAHGVDQWTRAVAPFIDAWQRESRTTLGMPAFGIGREQQERMQRLLQAQLDYQQRDAAHNALMAQVAQQALEKFQDKLAEREEPGRGLTSARALFDLWIDAAEEAYAETALSPRFRESYGALVNAQMRLRKAVQDEIERICGLFGMPSRTEVDSAHRKIAELERALRRLRDSMPDTRAGQPPPADGKAKRGRPVPTPEPVARQASKSGAKLAAKAAGRKAAAAPAKRPATKQPAGKGKAR